MGSPIDQNAPMFDGYVSEDLTPEEIAQLRRRRLVRAAIVIVVVVAMIAAILIPVIVRIVHTPRPPDTVIAHHAGIAWRRMVV